MANKRIDFGKQLVNISGEKLVDQRGNDLLLGTLCADCLLIEPKRDNPISGSEKVRLFELAQKTYRCAETVVDEEEIELIKNAIIEHGSILVAGQSVQYIDGVEYEPDDTDDADNADNPDNPTT